MSRLATPEVRDVCCGIKKNGSKKTSYKACNPRNTRLRLCVSKARFSLTSLRERVGCRSHLIFDLSPPRPASGLGWSRVLLGVGHLPPCNHVAPVFFFFFCTSESDTTRNSVTSVKIFQREHTMGRPRDGEYTFCVYGSSSGEM